MAATDSMAKGLGAFRDRRVWPAGAAGLLLAIVSLPAAAQNQSPTITSAAPASATAVIGEQTSRTFQVLAVDPEGSNLTYAWTWDALPVGTDTNIYTRATAWGDAGVYELNVTVSDGQAPDTSTSWAVHITADNDGDQMPNAWERLHSLDPWNSGDASLDPDGDFLTNLQEYQHHTSPTNRDTDGDTLDDAWEVAHDLNPVDDSNHLAIVTAVLRAKYDTPGHAWNVDVVQGKAYVADGAGGLIVLDVNNSTNPLLLGSLDVSYPREVRDVEVVSTQAYLATWGLEGYTLSRWLTQFDILDVDPPTNIEVLGSYGTYGLSWSVEVRSNRAYVGTLNMQGTYKGLVLNARVDVLDISDPSNVTNVDSYGQTFAGPHFARDVHVGQQGLYVADMNAGLYVLNLSGEDDVPPAGNYVTPGYEDGDETVLSVFTRSNVAFLACGRLGLHVVGGLDTTNLVLLDAHDTPGHASGIVVVSNLAFIADGNAGVRVFNTHDPIHVTPVTDHETDGWAESVDVASNIIYVADGTNGLVIIELVDDDTDDDGLSDTWESLRFGTLTNTASGDNDADGISHLGEYRAGLNPLSGDQDADGLPDGWEIRELLSPTNAADAALDPDGDTYDNTDEFVAGTRAGNPASYFHFTNPPSSGPKGPVISWPSMTNRYYTLAQSTNLGTGGSFSNVVVDAPGTPPSNSYTSASHGARTLFFKLRVRE